MNPENLLKMSELTPEERHAMGVRAGTASGVARKRKADIRSALRDLLSMTDIVPDEDDVKTYLSASGIDKPTSAEAVAASAYIRARRGDVEAMRFVRDSSGEMPTNRVEVAGDPTRPIASMDLSSMTDDQLRAVAEGLENASSCTDKT